jgi:hypothetical protein
MKKKKEKIIKMYKETHLGQSYEEILGKENYAYICIMKTHIHHIKYLENE